MRERPLRVQGGREILQRRRQQPCATLPPMPALDHVFVFCRPGAPEAARLEAAGLRAGRERQHEGQGTANKCFFFANAMLELIWIEDEAEARSELVRPLGLWERANWRQTGASPFGFCLRLRPGVEMPVPTWDYRPPYLPEGAAIQIVRDQQLQQPLVFAIAAKWEPPPLEHRLRQSRVTRCISTQPTLPPSELDVFEARVGEHHFDIELDGGGSVHVLDCRPELPLTLRW